MTMPEDGESIGFQINGVNNLSANKEFITTNLLVFLGISIVVGITFFLLSLETFSQNVDLIFLALLSLSIGLQSSVIIWPLIQNIPSLSNSTMFSWDNDSWAFLAGSNMIFQKKRSSLTSVRLKYFKVHLMLLQNFLTLLLKNVSIYLNTEKT